MKPPSDLPPSPSGPSTGPIANWHDQQNAFDVFSWYQREFDGWVEPSVMLWLCRDGETYHAWVKPNMAAQPEVCEAIADALEQVAHVLRGRGDD